jgi:Protein of unknown function (DUF3040)
MPLSDHEQRILAEIERRLLEEDPKFAQQVGSSFRAHLARRLKLAVVGFVLGLIILVVGFVNYVAVGVAGFVIMLASVFLFVRTMRRRASVDRPAAASGQPQQPPQRPGPAGGWDSWWGRATERWRQRWEERGGQGPP